MQTGTTLAVAPPDGSPRPLRGWIAIFVLLHVACASSPFLPSVAPTRWRGASLYESGSTGVVAIDPGEAAEVEAVYAKLLAAIRQQGLADPARSLCIALESGREDLLGDEATAKATLLEWDPTMRLDSGDGDVQGRPPFDLALTLLVLHPPLDTPRLALPIERRQRFGAAFVIPSDTCLDRAIDRLFDFAMEREHVGFGKRLLLAPLRPLLRGEACAELRQMQYVMLLRWLLPAEVDKRCLEGCLEALGIDRRKATDVRPELYQAGGG